MSALTARRSWGGQAIGERTAWSHDLTRTG